jgi:hypothetical protein
MAKKAADDFSDIMRGRMGMLFLMFSTGMLLLAVKFFSSTDLVVMQFDFRGSEDFYGWICMTLSLVTSCTALMFGILMKR